MSAPLPAPGKKPGLVNPAMYKDFIELYNQIAQKVLTFENNRKKLVEILMGAMPRAQLGKVFTVDGKGEMTKLELATKYLNNPEWMNPFSFFIFLNAYLPPNPVGNWNSWMDNLGRAFAINKTLVDNAKMQMPWPDNGNQHYPQYANRAHYFNVLDGWMQNYFEINDPDTVTRLWRLATYATYKLPPDPNTKDPVEKQFINDFNAVAPRLRRNVALMSAGLNWMNPGVWIRASYTRYQDYYQVF